MDGPLFKSFREMPVWQEAMDVAEVVFKLSETFPKKEDYGLTSQLRRAALSISANVAEAYGEISYGGQNQLLLLFKRFSN